MNDIEHAPLTREEATLLTNQIQKAITLAWDLIVRAYRGRAWAALGYNTWDQYCEGEFGHSRLSLPAEERRHAVRSLRENGLSTRAIASATGVTHTTIRNDLERSGGEFLPTSEVTGIDGKTYQSTTRTGDDEVIDAEIVEEEDGVGEPRRRAPLPKQFARPVTEVLRSARRVAELTRDDRLRVNAELISDAYLPRIVEAHQALGDAIDAIEKRNGAAR